MKPVNDILKDLNQVLVGIGKAQEQLRECHVALEKIALDGASGERLLAQHMTPWTFEALAKVSSAGVLLLTGYGTLADKLGISQEELSKAWCEGVESAKGKYS